MSGGRWPFDGDGPTARARKVALAYRSKLAELDAAAVAQVDAQVAAFGQHWAVPTLDTVAPGVRLAPAQAAEYAGVNTGTLREWRRRGRLVGHRMAGGWEYDRDELTRAVADKRRRGRAS